MNAMIESNTPNLDAPGVTVLKQLAAQALDETDGDWQRAATWLRQRIDGDAELFRSLMEPMVDIAIWRYIGMMARIERHAYKPGRPDMPDGLNALGERTRHLWMNYPLNGGLRLGDATKEHVLAQARIQEHFARGNRIKEEFFHLIAAEMGDKRVRDTLTEQQLNQLWRQVT